MQIDKEKFIALLAEKTEAEEPKVKQQLDELISKIWEEAGEDAPFEIEGFGTFQMEDGVLQFEASENLETEINHKYAGMQPIELIGAFKDTPDVPVDKEDVWGIEESTDKEDAPVEKEAHTSGSDRDAETKEGQPEVEDEPEQEPVSSFTFNKETSEKETSSEPENLEDEEQVEAEKGSPVPHSSRDTETKKAEQKEQPVAATAASKKKTKREEADPIGKFLVAAVIVVALGASGWFVYDFGLLDSIIGGNAITESRTTQNTGTPPPGSQKTSSVSSTDRKQPVSEQKKDDDVSKSSSIAESSRQTIYGLRGGAVPQAPSGYTIVVHSLRSKSKAEEIEQSLKSEGYLTILTSGVVRGTTRWRVGLGQFKDVEDAKQAMSQLPSSYKQNNFIRKF